jgi:hypothetical protein
LSNNFSIIAKYINSCKLKVTIVEKCCENDCKFIINSDIKPIILKGEKIFKQKKICDYIIFIDGDIIKFCLAELKSKTSHPSDIEAQLQNGADVIQNILNIINITCLPQNFYPLVLHKGMNNNAWRLLVKIKINVAGRKVPIDIQRCGAKLKSVLEI